jgi:hypothetical protein
MKMARLSMRIATFNGSRPRTLIPRSLKVTNLKIAHCQNCGSAYSNTAGIAKGTLDGVVLKAAGTLQFF